MTSTFFVPEKLVSQLPTNLDELYDFIFYFDGTNQPIIHQYPWMMPLIAIPLYWMMVFFGPRLMEKREAFKLRVPLMLWNLLLCGLSIFMFLGMVFPIISFLLKEGFRQLMCMPGGELYFGLPFFSVWLFALSKFLELVDTLFIILRKRPVHFLHWYHHTTVLAYTWFAVVTLAAPGAMFAAVNAGVHCVMYFYYFLASIGSRPSWGILVTIIQLTQMLVGITISILWVIYYLSAEGCTMAYPQAYMWSTSALYASYFILFLKFFIERYVQKGSPTATKAPTSKGASPNRPRIKKE